MNYLLSIIIISYNQRDELDRCIKSVLSQNLPFDYEIVLSDDRSTDGSYELAKEYEEKYSNITSYQCNSDECEPINRAQRAAWNRCNGYSHASGKYIVHIDGDDYYRFGSDVLARQVEILESHPECSLCMGNILCLEKEQPIESGHPWFPRNRWMDGEIITAEKFILEDYFLLNQAFMMRRNPDIDPVKLYGKRYDDSIITYHHLQFGPIVCVSNCDYVYVQYPESISASVSCDMDGWVLSCLAIIIPKLFPQWRDVYYLSKLSHLYLVVKLALKRFVLKEQNYETIRELNIFLFSAFNRKIGTIDYLRLMTIRAHLFLMIRLKWHSKRALDSLEKLMV